MLQVARYRTEISPSNRYVNIYVVPYLVAEEDKTSTKRPCENINLADKTNTGHAPKDEGVTLPVTTKHF